MQTLQYFGLKESEVPLLFIQASTAKYIKPTVEPDQILPWLKEYTVRPLQFIMLIFVWSSLVSVYQLEVDLRWPLCCFSQSDFGFGSRRMAPYYHMSSQIQFRWSTTNLLKLSLLIISMMWFSTLAKMVCSLHYDLLLKEVLVYIPYQVFLLDVWCLFCCHFNFKN